LICVEFLNQLRDHFLSKGWVTTTVVIVLTIIVGSDSADDSGSVALIDLIIEQLKPYR
jgi:hypothetical protein